MQTDYEVDYNIVTAFYAALGNWQGKTDRRFYLPNFQTVINSMIVFNVVSTLAVMFLVFYMLLR